MEVEPFVPKLKPGPNVVTVLAAALPVPAPVDLEAAGQQPRTHLKDSLGSEDGSGWVHRVDFENYEPHETIQTALHHII